MFGRAMALALLPALLASAPFKKTTVGSGRGENEDLILSVTLYTTPADVKELLGDDLGGHYIVADVKVEPKYGKSLNIDRDDFVLHTDANGDKETPVAASQIAGRESLLVTDGAPNKKGRFSGPGWTGPDMPAPPNINVKEQTTASGSQSPLEKTLNDKILVEQKTEKPVNGLLYFPMEKQKMKDLEIRYGTGDKRITLRFK